jgi:hypothetical protein
LEKPPAVKAYWGKRRSYLLDAPCVGAQAASDGLWISGVRLPWGMPFRSSAVTTAGRPTPRHEDGSYALER